MAPYLRSCPKQQRRPASQPVTALKTCGSPVSAHTACAWSGTRVCWSTAGAETPQAEALPTSAASKAAAKAIISTTMLPKNSCVYGTRRLSILFWMVRKRQILFFFPSQANASPPMLFKVITVTLDLGLYDVKWSCLRWGVVRSRCLSWNTNNFRFQMRPKPLRRESQHVGLRWSTDFQPLMGKWHIVIYSIMWLCQDFVTFVPFFWKRNYLSTLLIPTTITSQISYGMHKAGQCISGQLNTSRGTIECHSDQRNHASINFHPGEGKFGWWISFFLLKLCEIQFFASWKPVHDSLMLLQCWRYLFRFQSEIMEDYFCIILFKKNNHRFPYLR